MVIASLVNPIAKLAIDPQIKSKYVTKKKKLRLDVMLGSRWRGTAVPPAASQAKRPGGVA